CARKSCPRTSGRKEVWRWPRKIFEVVRRRLEREWPASVFPAVQLWPKFCRDGGPQQTRQSLEPLPCLSSLRQAARSQEPAAAAWLSAQRVLASGCLLIAIASKPGAHSSDLSWRQ